MRNASVWHDDDMAYWRPYTQMERPGALPRIVLGSGLRLVGADGAEFLDATSGGYGHCFGHSDPGLVEAVTAQLSKLGHMCNTTVDTGLPGELARQLVHSVGAASLRHVFLASSGSEGVEAALKMAWWYHFHLGRPRSRIASLDGGYHGCTLGALLATQRAFSKMGLPIASETNSVCMPPPHADGGDLSAWEALLNDKGHEIAAIVLEPVMGLAGARALPEGFLAALCSLARRHGVLTIADEVFCGMGRAGSICESLAQRAEPDVVVFSKCLGGGLPISAVLASEQVFESFLGDSAARCYRNGHTHSGNLLGCAAALYVLDRLRSEGWCERVRARGQSLLADLSDVVGDRPGVKGVRGKGLMIAIEMTSPDLCHRVQQLAFEGGLIVGTAGQSLKIAPAFIISSSEAQRLVETIDKSLSSAIGQAINHGGAQ